MLWGARRMIDRLLGDGGYRVGIATGGWRRTASVKLDHIGLRPEAVIFRGADGLSRREDIIQDVIDRAASDGPPCDRVVYVGDAAWDVTATRNMQVGFIGVCREGDHDRLRRLGAQHVISSYLDQAAFLELVAAARPPVQVEP